MEVWLDCARPEFLEPASLRRMITDDGVSGVSASAPAFTPLMPAHAGYAITGRPKTVEEVYRTICAPVARDAADAFLPIYEATSGSQGFVAVELPPDLACDGEGVMEEAWQLWEAVQRPNVMIRFPATREVLPAIQQLTREGVSTNVTMVLSVARYTDVAEAYLGGIRERGARGAPLHNVKSVVSFELAYIDEAFMPVLDATKHTGDPKGQIAQLLEGSLAVATAKLAFRRFTELFQGPSFEPLADKGAHAQQLCWSDIGKGLPAHQERDYIRELTGLEAVLLVTPELLQKLRAEGEPKQPSRMNLEEAELLLKLAREIGLEGETVMERIEEERIKRQILSFDRAVAGGLS